MAGKVPLSLPLPDAQYNAFNESVTRRSLELEIQSLRSDINRAKIQSDSVGSLAMRKFQFLLMGASNG
jgi:hypothetical protein